MLKTAMAIGCGERQFMGIYSHPEQRFVLWKALLVRALAAICSVTDEFQSHACYCAQCRNQIKIQDGCVAC